MLKKLARTFLATGAGLAFIVWIAAMASSLVSGKAQALPTYAQRTGLVCGQCHINPSGGGPRTAFGAPSRRTATVCPANRAASGLIPDGVMVLDTAMARE
ncbi:MAG: hypothetical protein WB822_05785 [Rhodoplanes sp.]